MYPSALSWFFVPASSSLRCALHRDSRCLVVDVIDIPLKRAHGVRLLGNQGEPLLAIVSQAVQLQRIEAAAIPLVRAD